MAPLPQRERPGRMHRLALILVLLSACSSEQPARTVDADVAPVPDLVTCGDPTVPSFPRAVLSQPGGLTPQQDQPAAVLPSVVRESQGVLPERGWVRAAETDDTVLFVARGGAGVPWSMVTFELRDGIWQADAYGQCHLQPEVPDGIGIAEFRLAPRAELTSETEEVQVLVTEMACNSGGDAHGRIRVLGVVPAAESITALIGVIPRPGDQNCPGNPETPFTLKLPEPLGDRTLLDGSSVPARDATTCPGSRMCP